MLSGFSITNCFIFGFQEEAGKEITYLPERVMSNVLLNLKLNNVGNCGIQHGVP